MESTKIIQFAEAKKRTRVKQKNLEEITIMRSISMLGVIAIHMLNIPISLLPVGTPWQGFFYTLRSLLIFAMPSFIFISMLMTSYSLGGNKLMVWDFYKRKLFRVGLPYLIWSFGYLLMLTVFGLYQPSQVLSPQALWYFLAYGKSYEHLYFMIILLQLFLITPLLLPLAKRVKDSPYLALGLAFGTQLIIYYLNRFFIYEHFKMLSSTFLWYFSIGFLGLWFGLEYQRNLKTIQKYQNKLIVALAVAGVIYHYYQRILWQQLWNDVSFNTLYYTIDLHLYMLLCALVLIIISLWVSQQSKNKFGQNSLLKRYLLWLSPLSYGVYLMHPVFTYLVRLLISSNSPWVWLLMVLVGVHGIALVTGQIVKWLQQIPVISLAFGVSAKGNWFSKSISKKDANK